MKNLNSYIKEALISSKNKVKQYKYFPKSKEELKSIIDERIEKEGNKCNLNDIDTSKITDMSELFRNSKFNGDISNWNVSNVNNMSFMFYKSKFNGDISKWDVSKVRDMQWMFAYSKFNQDISNWNLACIDTMIGMFSNTKYFNQDISNWKIPHYCFTSSIFDDCIIKKEYLPTFL